MKTLTPEQIKSIPVLLAEGKTQQEVATLLGIHKITVHYWVKKLREAGHEVPQKPGRKPIAL